MAFRIALGALSICFCAIYTSAAMAADDTGPMPAKVSKETTYITEPLNADGTVDYVTYVDRLAAKGITSDRNAAVLFLSAIGPDALGPTNSKVQERLNLRLPREGKYLITLDDLVQEQTGKSGAELAQAQQEADALLDKAHERPWTAREFPMLDRWLNDNKTALDLIVESSKREQFYYPLIADEERPGLIGVVMPYLNSARATTDSLRARVTRSLGAGNVEAAWSDAIAVYRLGRLLRSRHGFLVERLVGVGVEARANEALLQIASFAKVTSGQCRSMLKELRWLPEVPSFAVTIDVERLAVLDCLQQCSRIGTWPDLLYERMPNDANVPDSKRLLDRRGGAPVIDYNQAMILVNQMHEGAIAALSAGDYVAISNAMAKAYADVSEHEALSDTKFIESYRAARRDEKIRMMTPILVKAVIPKMGAAYSRDVACGMQTELSKVALALAAFRADVGRFPEALDALSPKYLANIPQDVFTGKALIYRRESDGGCIAYSVGWNLTDDGGNTEGLKDLVVRLPPKGAK